MDDRTITVLGINGHIGHAAARAFAEAGWRVVGVGRSQRRPVPGVAFVAGNADSVEDMRAALAGSAVVLNALNPPYDKWSNGRAEALMARVLEAAGTEGRTVLFPGNIYNYAARDRLITPLTPQRPETERGAIRKRMEAMLEAAGRSGAVRAVVLRAGDFFGSGLEGEWFDLMILRDIAKGRVSLPEHEIAHAWAYVPDLARAFVALAERREGFGPVETFHFPGHFVTPARTFAAIARLTDRPLVRTGFPWGLIGLAGLVMPVMREVRKMRYLWDNPMQLADPRLEDLLGADFGTPYDAAMAEGIGHLVRQGIPSTGGHRVSAAEAPGAR